MEVFCKKLSSEDSRMYRDLRLESLKLSPESFGSSYEEQSQLPKLFFEKLIEEHSETHVMIGAFANGQLVGICGLIPTDCGDALEVVQMYVSATARGKSVGQQLLSKACSILSSRLESKLELTVYLSNDAAINAYEKFGFKQVFKTEHEMVMNFEP
ncbi:GNAT family N-acetyltransferase [Vibrio sp. SCSIO 43136]|nr:GNAT family N-acetyltransferase [Vibrio sp. SCSIO 43136]